MPQFSDYTANALLDAYAAIAGNFGTLSAGPARWLALFDGATELTNTGYARKQLLDTDLDAAAAARAIANDTEVTFAEITAGGGQVTDIKIFDASTAGNELHHAPRIDKTTSRGFAANATSNEIYVGVGHGFVADETVRVSGTDLPAGLDEDTTYYVKGVTTTLFALSLTQGGATVDITGNGHGVVSKTAYNTVDPNTTFRFAVGEIEFQL